MRRPTTTLVMSACMLFLAGSACRDANAPMEPEPAQPEPLLGLPLTGTIVVTTATSGDELDWDGYTATVDFILSQPAPTEGSVTFGGVLTGVHLVTLDGVAANCSVSGGNSQTVLLLPGGTAGVDFQVSCVGSPPPPPPPTEGRVTGAGAIGPGTATPGEYRVEIDADVAFDLTGRVFIRDWTVVRADGSVATITVDPSDPETRITAFRNESATCADPAVGVEFDGVGRVNTAGDSDPAGSELLDFSVTVCDNGSPGVGLDEFGFIVPAQEYTVGPDRLTEGDLAKSN